MISETIITHYHFTCTQWNKALRLSFNNYHQNQTHIHYIHNPLTFTKDSAITKAVVNVNYTFIIVENCFKKLMEWIYNEWQIENSRNINYESHNIHK